MDGLKAVPFEEFAFFRSLFKPLGHAFLPEPAFPQPHSASAGTGFSPYIRETKPHPLRY
jgi:hypothetical protein